MHGDGAHVEVHSIQRECEEGTDFSSLIHEFLVLLDGNNISQLVVSYPPNKVAAAL